MQIVAITGLRCSPFHAAIDLFETGGLAAIRPAIRRCSRGNGRVLSPVKEETIQRMVIEQATGATQDGLQLVESRRKKPIKRAYEQSPEAVQNWLQGEYPACRFPFKLALLIFQLALVTLSPCHPPAPDARGAYPSLHCRATTPQRLWRSHVGPEAMTA